MAMRGDYPKTIGPITLPVTALILYTAPQRVRVKFTCASNITAVAATLTVHLCQPPGTSGSTPANSNMILGAFNIPGNDMMSFPFDVVLEPRMTIQALSNTDSAISITLTVTDQERE